MENNQPKVFELYWSWYEDYSPYQFYHNNKTENQFKRDVNKLMRKHALDYIKNEDGWVGLPGLVEDVAEKLVKLGYVRLQIHSKYGFFGGYILDNRTNKKEERKFKKLFGEKILKKFYAHNKKVQKRL